MTSPEKIESQEFFTLPSGGAPEPQRSPLIRTSFDLEARRGLAVFSIRRLFKNETDGPIEASLTFPMPVHATLYELKATVGDRTVSAISQSRADARETYEDGLDAGRLSVLHEERLRSIHMLSVGQIPPGADVQVQARWAMPMAALGATHMLRVPMTVGDVYGCGGLLETDEIHADGPFKSAPLRIGACDSVVTIGGRRVAEGDVLETPLDQPLDIFFGEWSKRPLFGRAADGRAVSLSIAPRECEDRNLQAAVLMDCSSSMATMFSGDDPSVSKHDAAVGALRNAARKLFPADKIDLWSFDDLADPVGSGPLRDALANDARDLLDALVGEIGRPSGGTRAGAAISELARNTTLPDILLITDGLTFDVDLQDLARLGRRICVLLIGEDSLEANVGHLAALTGGEVFVANAQNLDAALYSAIESLRSEAGPSGSLATAKDAVTRMYSGMQIDADWGVDGAVEPDHFARAVAAVAAFMAVQAMTKDEAEAFAVAEGLATHLTSLVLVDEKGDVVMGVAEFHKLSLSEPRVSASARAAVSLPRSFLLGAPCRAVDRQVDRRLERWERRRIDAPAASWRSPNEIPEFLRRSSERASTQSEAKSKSIDWSRADKLAAGDLSSLPSSAKDLLSRLQLNEDLQDLAALLGVDVEVLALALLAKRDELNTSAARVFLQRVLPRTEEYRISILSMRLRRQGL